RTEIEYLPRSTIDRRSPVPFYFQLKTLLERDIRSRYLLPGERLPSEPSLCRHFGVSRSTVRQALAELELDGLVHRERGRGTFVREPESASWLLQSEGFFHDE